MNAKKSAITRRIANTTVPVLCFAAKYTGLRAVQLSDQSENLAKRTLLPISETADQMI